MKKKKIKLVLIIGVVVIAAVAVTASLLTVLSNVLKPADFEYVEIQSGENTGYYRYCYGELNQNERNIYNVRIGSLKLVVLTIKYQDVDNTENYLRPKLT